MGIARLAAGFDLNRALLLAGILAFSAGAGFVKGQILHATGERPAFEVATIKPWKSPPDPPPRADGTSAPARTKVAPVGGGGQTTNRVHMILPAVLLIASAYNLPVGSENRIVRGPNWLRQDMDQYEIEAKIDDAVFAAMKQMSPAQQREQVSLMEQSLLADRFKFQAHFEKVEMPVYAMVVARGGAKLMPARDGDTSKLSMVRDEKGMNLTAQAVTIEEFARSPFLTGASGRVVLDQTGLRGAYSFALKWDGASDAANSTAGEAPSLFTAMQEQLGLRLAASRAPLEVVVVDHIEPPASN